tara:strand:- start:4132 stop:4980 length:849 start_codon:yes stop_codon:yes gene_type:complete
MAKRITLQALGEDDELTRLLCYDSVCGSIMFRFLLGGEDETAISIGKICEAIGVGSKSVVKRRIDWLIEYGLLNKTDGKTKWDATSYSINYESKLFVKKRTVKRGLMEIESEDQPFESVDSTPAMYSQMVDMFTERNFQIHGKKWIPRSSKARDDWEHACKKIMEFDGMTPEIFADVVDFLANQYKEYLNGERYAMQVQSVPNLLVIQQNKGITKLESALDKMQAQSNLKPGTPRNTESNRELLRRRAANRTGDNTYAKPRSNDNRLLRGSIGGGFRSDSDQ